MLKTIGLAGALLLGLAAAPLQAAITIFEGTTEGAPTWNRPLEDFSALSAVGTDVAYVADSFTVTVSGLYDFLEVADAEDSWDNYLFLYAGSFDPLAPFANGVVGNDDFGAIGISGFTGISLMTGITYFAVTTGFGNFDFGKYALVITGPGAAVPPVTVVPEPASWGMMLAGLGAVGYALRRQKSLKISFG
ncbi:PEPxxWA-CTERM sorting domain-containing protein [Sphingobium sp. SYK-6]|uniref:PEPxxWA-CTERM sorting domain-containing protein n=1 Tax=Sphingobium sp. (strain NBRC 103272 / SYK-6) TaxID=627192 RepID=UPI00059BBE1D|nr:PEPxxWA-CTERM sorting domain-containing protein [Sphingobium sp. SYK-6]